MTTRGLMLGAALRDFSIEADDAVIYVTTFGETITLARYLESFPTASPLLFQTSIHPSAIEQVLINRGCPVRELTPLAGQPDLSAHASLAALLTPGERVLLTGGEEIGSWMRQAGELRWCDEGGPSSAAAVDLQELFQAVRERQPMRLSCPSGGEITLTWF